ncbi:MAG: CopG family transcriptional regulator [Ruminococcaceae bacterium]|nr:CopG family transcriptional regulator [Oscillospiraceae bacterium]
MFSVRIKDSTVEQLEYICKRTNRSRNEIIGIMLRYGIDNRIIEEYSHTDEYRRCIFILFKRNVSELVRFKIKDSSFDFFYLSFHITLKGISVKLGRKAVKGIYVKRLCRLFNIIYYFIYFIHISFGTKSFCIRLYKC